MSNIRRAYEACSSWDLFHKEINRTRQALINNGYSNTGIDEEINKYLNHAATSSSFPVAVLGGALCICICSNKVLFSYLSMEDG